MIRNRELGSLIKEALIEEEETSSKKIKNSYLLLSESVSIFLVTIPDDLQKINFKSKNSS